MVRGLESEPLTGVNKWDVSWLEVDKITEKWSTIQDFIQLGDCKASTSPKD